MAFESRLSIVVDSTTGERRLKNLEGQMRATDRAGERLTTTFLAASGALAGLGAGMSLTSAIRTVGDFEQEMKSLQAVTMASSKEMRAFADQARELGAVTRYGANQAAQAQKFLAQAGLEANQVLAATPGILQLAQAGMMDLGSAADLATDIMAQMGLEVSDLSRINDVLVKTSQSATTDVRQLGEAFSYAGPVASSFGLSLEDTGAALGVISSSGIKASRAGTGLLGVLRQLAIPTNESAEALASYGVTLDEVDVSARGFSPVLATLEEANISAADAFTIFGSEAGAAAQALINGRGQYLALAGDLDRVNGTARDAAATMSDSLNAALDGLQSALAEAALQGGDEGLAGSFRNLIDLSTGVIQVFNGMEEEWAEANGKGEDFIATIRGIAEPLQEIGIQFNLTAQEIIASIGEADAYMTETFDWWGDAGQDSASFIGDAFRNLPANIKAMVEIATVELLVLVDKAQAYGQAIDKYLNPVNWVNGAWDSIGESLDAQIALVDQVRLDSISDILEDRERIVGAFDIEQDVERQAKALERLEDRALSFVSTLGNVSGATSGASAQFKTLDEWMFELDKSAGGAGASVTALAESSASATSELDRQAESAQGLVDELYPLQASQRQYAEDKARLVQYALQENKSNEWLAESMRRLDDSYRSNQAAAEAYGLEVDNLADRADPMADAFQEATRRIDETFADAFTGAFDSFDDFADQLLDGFKRLLGELAYQATLKPIVVGFTADMQGALGIGGAQGQGFSGTLSGLNNAAGGIDSLFGTNIRGGITNAIGLGGSAAGGAAIGYGGAGFASQVATGTYGGWAGSAAAGASASGGLMGTLGAAMPWIGAGLLVDNLLGLGIVDGIVGGVSDALGISGKYAGEDPTGILATRNEFGSAGRAGWEREAFATGALGDIGFARESRDIDSLFGERDNYEAAREYAQQLAQLDNTVAQLASNEAELDAMRQAAAGAGLQSMADVDQRYVEILGTLGPEFGEFVGGIEGGLEQVVGQGVEAYRSLDVLSTGVDRLGLQFDTAGSAAYGAAAGIAELVGGAQSLASLQQGYYGAFYTEAEQVAHLGEDLAARFGELGLRLPTTDEGVRSLVEGLDLMTESGREQYAAILQLVPQLDRWVESMQSAGDVFEGVILPTSTVDTLQGALAAYEGATQASSELAGQRSAQLEDERRAMQSLSDLLDELVIGSDSALSGGARFAAAQSRWAELIARASTGDTEAVSALSGASQDVLGLARNNASTALEYARTFASVTGDIAGLEDEYGESVHELRSVESIASDQLREQEMARETLIDQLLTQVDTLDGIYTISGLLNSLPAGIADQLRDIISAPSDTGKGDVLPDGEFVDPSGLSPAGQALNAIYQDVLGRNIDETGLAYYLDLLRDGHSLGDIRGWIEDDKADGAHRSGLDRVPFDGYRALLHKGEFVATADEAPAVRALLNGDLPMAVPVPAAPSMSGGQSYAAMIAELKALRHEVGRLTGYARTTADSTSQTASLNRRWEFAGIPETRS